MNRAKGDSDCTRCHTEHYGREFYIIKWPTVKDEFDHRLTGYTLEGRHARLKCEECHNARHISAEARKTIRVKNLNKTFEGLSPACLTCHEDHHQGQVSADCQHCHDFVHWKPQRGFDHMTTRFPLTGRHHDVPCEKCHKPLAANAKVIQYKDLNFAECTGCHQDPHHGAFAARCESCHNTTNWKEVRINTTFDHSKTKFPLLGKHAAVACLKCHKDANFKTPVAHEKCLDCHQDQHQGQFQQRADHGECAACHNEKGWRPTTFTVTSHESTGYPLKGRHAAVACAKCHPPAATPSATNYHPAFKACLDCHKDPHGGQFSGAPFANRCDQCHKVEGFQPSTFSITRHQTTDFPLRGAHEAVGCADCHHEEPGHNGRDRQFLFVKTNCEACHQDPHNGDFPAVMRASLKPGQDFCENCHGLRSWQDLKPFDHSVTGYELAGSHRSLLCTDCHRPANQDSQIRRIAFKGAPEQCVGCHEDIHEGQFRRANQAVECTTCHTPTHWAATVFDHGKNTNFPLTGAHERVPCRLCHNQRSEVNGRIVIIYRDTPRDCASCHKQ